MSGANCYRRFVEMNKHQVLDLSGYMFSGKAAVHDLISEIDGVLTPGNRLEFDLLRVKDGVADLENSIVSWSPIRSDEAVRRFLKLVKKMSQSNAGLRKLFVPGFDYGRRFPNLREATEKFISRITTKEWDMYWPYHLLEMGPFETFGFKLKRKLTGDSENICYRLVSGEEFYQALRDFLDEVLWFGVDDSKYHMVAINNGFEPYDPSRFVNYFHDARCIVVDRDPRDIFATSNLASEGFNDQAGLYQKIAGAHDVETFIERIRVYRANTSSAYSNKVLRVSFEDLVEDYASTTAQLLRFLGIDESKHTRKYARFNPEKSKANIGLWKQLPDQSDIRAIEKALM